LNSLCLAPHLDMFTDSLCVISVLTRLTSLTVNGCAVITPGFLRAMRCLPMLRSLDLSDEPFSENLAVKVCLSSWLCVSHLSWQSVASWCVAAVTLCIRCPHGMATAGQPGPG
jgi:hypothetical protein